MRPARFFTRPFSGVGVLAAALTLTLVTAPAAPASAPTAASASPAAAPAAAVAHEAENAVVSRGVVESNHAGYTGSGFVNYDNVQGGHVQWAVDAAQAGRATLTLRYANGTAASRPMDITVNGVLVADDRAFPSTGSWASWSTVTLTTDVKAGANTVRATATTSAGGPNV
ncbi:carbohydrate-binding protein, partial [Streptomyces zhihengii]